MKGLILWVPAARSDRQIHAIVDAVTAVIALDAAYKGGAYTENPVEGIKRAGMVYFPWLFSEEYLDGLVRTRTLTKQRSHLARDGRRFGMPIACLRAMQPREPMTSPFLMGAKCAKRLLALRPKCWSCRA